MTFAARDFSPRRGVSDEHIPQWICEERATKSGRKRPAALRVAPNLACGFVARRLQPHGRGCALLAPCHRPNWAQRTSSYLCFRPLSCGGMLINPDAPIKAPTMGRTISAARRDRGRAQAASAAPGKSSGWTRSRRARDTDSVESFVVALFRSAQRRVEAPARLSLRQVQA